MGLCGSCVVLFGLSWAVCEVVVEKMTTDREVVALSAMQHAAAEMALEARRQLKSLDELTRLALLQIRLASEHNESGQRATLETMAVAMKQHRLGVRALSVRHSDGTLLLQQGNIPTGGPSPIQELGLSRPWRNLETGEWYERYSLSLPGYPDLIIRISLDPVALSAELQRVLPPELSARAPAVATLIRLSDGAFVARSDSAERILADQPPLQPRSLSTFREREAGAARLISVVNGRDSLIGFRSMADLGIVASVSATTDEMMAFNELATRQVRRVPLLLLPIFFAISAIAMALAMRRRANAAVASASRKAVAEAAARAELAELVRCSPAMLYRGQLDCEGVYSREYVTPNSLTVTGWEPEMLSDPERVWKLSADEDRHLRGTNYARALKLGRSSMDYRFLRPDGGYSWLRNEALIVQRRTDGGATVVGAVTNITRERELAAQGALQSRMATLGQLSTSLAHELTQPITVIGMSAAIARSMLEQLAPGAELPRELWAQIDQILHQTDRAGDMIRHLRTYGHADSGPLANVDLEQAVTGAMTLTAIPLREAGVDVRLDLQAGIPMVRARMVQVEQVLVNLIINARDAMRSMPADSRRLVLSATGGSIIRLSVSDTGPGVPPDSMMRLFEAFYTTKPPGHGTGLGLSLSQTMMRSFGGEISVESNASGAIFTLEFQPAT
jgi:C4-dicarboxylate-specific signal transduction histidine kinase